MDRRKFFKVSAPLGLTPLLINGTPLKTFANSDLLRAMDCTGVSERVIVLVQLKGGNDGLNTLVPLDQYATYQSLRPNIALPSTGANSYLTLDNTLPTAQHMGLHPSMQGFKSLYDDGLMSIINAVAYNSPNRSHFKSTDLWLTGGDGSQTNYNIPTGWMGRYLDHMFPGYAGNPDTLMPDPLGIQLGDNQQSLGFHSASEHASAVNLSYASPGGFYNLINEIGGTHVANVPNTEYGKELEYIMNVEDSTARYAQRISDVFNAGSNSAAVTYPAHYFANQLKTVARLIDGGSKTKIFLVGLGGFDTHVEQSELTDPAIGRHADLMYYLSEGVKAFQDDITALGHADKVMTVTFSEFGRKPIENESWGTDHGTIAPMFVIGKGVQPGVHGNNPDLTNVDNNGLFIDEIQHDYRQVFTTVLQDWLGSDDTAMGDTYFSPFLAQKLALVSPTHFVDPSCYVPPLVNLPVSLVSFDAYVVDDYDVALTWETESEINNSHFVIERSKDGVDFMALVQIPGHGTTNQAHSYRTIDVNPFFGTSYYRLKQVDYDGKETIEDIKAVTIEQSSEFSIKLFPNPASKETTLKVISEGESEVFFKLFNMGGQLVKELTLPVFIGQNDIPINLRGVSSGTYFVQAVSKKGHKFSSKLMVVD